MENKPTATKKPTDIRIMVIRGLLGGIIAAFLILIIIVIKNQCPAGYTCSPKPAGCPAIAGLNCFLRSSPTPTPLQRPKQSYRLSPQKPTRPLSSIAKSFSGGRLFYVVGDYCDVLWICFSGVADLPG